MPSVLLTAKCCGYENGDFKWLEKDFLLKKASVLYQSISSAVQSQRHT